MEDNRVHWLHARRAVSRCLSPEEYVLFFDRLALVRKCKQLTGAELTTRTNVLLVRQRLLTPGNGVTFTYTSQKNTKRSHHWGQNPSAFERGGVRHLTLAPHYISPLGRLRRSAVLAEWRLREPDNFPLQPQLQGPHQCPSLGEDPGPSAARWFQLHQLPVDIHHGEHTLLTITHYCRTQRKDTV